MIRIARMEAEPNRIRIWFENLAVIDGAERESLSEITEGKHIHGGLRIEIGGRLVPYLGYFGADDVCFDTWLNELRQAAEVFRSSPQGRHVFDEGEQGQPAFVFERNENRAFFSIARSEISEGEGDPDWQRIEFTADEFVSQEGRFRESFISHIRSAAPAAADKWLQRVNASFSPLMGEDSGSRGL